VSADTDPTPYLTEPQRVQNLYRASLRALHDLGDQLRAERADHERTREELLRVRAERAAITAETAQQFDADTLATLEAWKPCIREALALVRFRSEISMYVGEPGLAHLAFLINDLSRALHAARHGGPDGDTDYLAELDG
jgi:hypothetical protein